MPMSATAASQHKAPSRKTRSTHPVSDEVKKTAPTSTTSQKKPSRKWPARTAARATRCRPAPPAEPAPLDTRCGFAGDRSCNPAERPMPETAEPGKDDDKGRRSEDACDEPPAGERGHHTRLAPSAHHPPGDRQSEHDGRDEPERCDHR